MNRLLTLRGPVGRLRDAALRLVPPGLATSAFVKQVRLPQPGALGSTTGR